MKSIVKKIHENNFFWLFNLVFVNSFKEKIVYITGISFFALLLLCDILLAFNLNGSTTLVVSSSSTGLMIYFFISLISLIGFSSILSYFLFHEQFDTGQIRMEQEAGFKIMISFFVRFLTGILIISSFTIANLIISFFFYLDNDMLKSDWYSIITIPSLAIFFLGLLFFSFTSVVVLIFKVQFSLLFSIFTLLILTISSFLTNALFSSNNENSKEKIEILMKMYRLSMGNDYYFANDQNTSDTIDDSFFTNINNNYNYYFANQDFSNINNFNNNINVFNHYSSLNNKQGQPYVAALNGFYLFNDNFDILKNTNLGNNFKEILDVFFKKFKPDENDLNNWFLGKENDYEDNNYMFDAYNYYSDPALKISSSSEALTYKKRKFNSFVDDLISDTNNKKVINLLNFAKNNFNLYWNFGGTTSTPFGLENEDAVIYRDNIFTDNNVINFSHLKDKPKVSTLFDAFNDLKTPLSDKDREELKREAVLYFENPEIMILLNVIANGEINSFMTQDLNIDDAKKLLKDNELQNYLNPLLFLSNFFGNSFYNVLAYQSMPNSFLSFGIYKYISLDDFENTNNAIKEKKFSLITKIEYKSNFYYIVIFLIFSILFTLQIYLSYIKYKKRNLS